MKIYFDPAALNMSPLAVAVGIFDGMHRGHQKIIATLVDRAAARRCEPAVLTFFPHPFEVLATSGPAGFQYLQTLDERLASLKELGVRHTLCCLFDEYFAAMSPEEFIGNYLIRHLRPTEIVVGENFRFGKGKSGDCRHLARLGKQHGIGCVIVPPLTCVSPAGPGASEPISSTVIRSDLAAGNLERPRDMLGRDYFWIGVVGKGKGLGRKIGYPTINMKMARPGIMPDGVYQSTVLLEDRARPAISYLFKPDRVNETYIFDYTGDLYNQVVKVIPERFIRPPRPFTGPEELVEWIRNDINAVRKLNH